MSRRRLCASLAGAGLALRPWGARAAPAPREPVVPFERFTLENGLTVILHVDKAAPTVHVELWYEAGARDERPGRTGIAHLLEHLMFQGTKHYPAGAYYRLLAEAGASSRNGITGHDHTRYHITLPARRAELALWLESSRMGFLLDRPGLDALIADQRAVIAREWERDVAGAPLGALESLLLASLYGPQHPYGHPPLAPPEDLEAVTEADVRSFYDQLYAPNNAALFVGGDIDVAEMKGLVEKYFGPIPRAPEPRRLPAPITRLGRDTRIEVEAPVRSAQLRLAWPTTPAFAPGDAALDVIAQLLAGGRAGRLQRRLALSARSVAAAHTSHLGAGRFEIAVVANDGHTLAGLENATMEELELLRRDGPSDRELLGARARLRVDLLRGLEGLEGRAAQLLKYTSFAGDTAHLTADLSRYQEVDATAIKEALARWLPTDGRVSVTVLPDADAPVAGRVRGGLRS